MTGEGDQVAQARFRWWSGGVEQVGADELVAGLGSRGGILDRTEAVDLVGTVWMAACILSGRTRWSAYIGTFQFAGTRVIGTGSTIIVA